ncbi:hypothetical protein [Humidesulfovibrio idahonensis]
MTGALGLDFVRLALPVAAFLVYVVLQLLCLHFGLAYVRSIALGFLAGLAALLAGEALILAPTADGMALVLVNLAIYGLAAYCFCIFMTLNVSALRIRILVELRQNPKGMSEQEMLGRYNAESIRKARIERLLGSGQIVRREGRLFLARRQLLPLVLLIDGLRLLLFGRRDL